MKNNFIKRSSALIALLLALCFVFSSCNLPFGDTPDSPNDNIEDVTKAPSKDTTDGATQEGSDIPVNPNLQVQSEAEKALGIPKYAGNPYVDVNGGVPKFTADEITTKSYEFYSELDGLGRCGYTEACIGKDLMPTSDRESISSVTPSGWINKKYSTDLVDGGYVYNRCHLIGFQLTGENANKQNLITGTRYMNVDGMLPFENMVADYVKETNNHVMYRVTPIYEGNDLVARGATIEAYSVEDNGEGISFYVYAYNVQPGITIDYATGNSWLSSEAPIETEAIETVPADEREYILNNNSKKIHLPTCAGVNDIKESNKGEYKGNIQDLIDQGYSPCGNCKPDKR